MSEQTDKWGRIAWMDMAKGISIVLIVVHHGQLYLLKSGLGIPEYSAYDRVLTLFRMPTFFFISGFLGASVVARSWPDFLRRRVVPLFYIFVLWGIIPLLYFGFVQTNIRKPLMGSDPIQLVQHFFRPASEIWFIWALIIFFLIARVTPHRLRLPLLALSVVLSALSFSGVFNAYGYVHSMTIRYAVFFFGGLFYGRLLLAWIMAHRVPSLVGAAIVGVGLLLFLQLTDPEFDRPYSGPALLVVTVCTTILAGAGAAALTRGPTMKRFGTYLGRNSLPIYVTHVIFLSIGIGLLAAFAADLPYVGYWSLPLLVVFATAAALGLSALSKWIGADWLFAMPAWMWPGPTKTPPATQQEGKEVEGAR